MKRRKFFQNLALLSTGLIVPIGSRSWVSLGANSPKSNNSDRLVVIFLRGAIDGLNVVVPYTDDEYYSIRPTLALNAPGESDGVINLDNNFGLHPALKDLMPLWQEKSLAFVNCCGLPNNNRSHFAVQHLIETGTPQNKNNNVGWMNRLLGEIHQNNPTQAINFGAGTNTILKGKNSVANLPRKESQEVSSTMTTTQKNINQLFSQLYQGNSELGKAYQEGLQAQQIFQEELDQEMKTANKGAPKSTSFVQEVGEMAALMKGNANAQLAFIDFGAWDTHTNEANTLRRLLPPLGQGLAKLKKELGNEYQNTTIVVMSEFGRTVKENGNRGTDHGHGNAMWVMGGKVKGGQIYGQWRGLAPNQLYQGRDLPVNTDYREVFAHILDRNFKLSQGSLNKIFPRFNSSKNLSFI